MKIKGNEYYTNDSYILKIFTNNKDLEILVEYHFQEVCVNEGYEIWHPVDQAHKEPSEYKYSVHIEKVNEIEDDEIGNEIYLSPEDCRVIEDYISELKQDEW